MTELLCKRDYEAGTAATRDARMRWWREARFGMFVHLGLYSVYGRHEWAMAMENWEPAEYAKFADGFLPREGCCRAWARLARDAGMKYMILTAKHHEGFSLWDSAANPFNSVRYGCKRDLLREFTDACREYGLGVGVYYSLMDWRHPDAWACAYDAAARTRFTRYIEDSLMEIMTGYGKIDILWYDIPKPLTSYEGWNTLEINQRIREKQPGILINNRCFLDEDFAITEGKILPADRDWEACMTFNGMSWGYLDSTQIAPYSHTAQEILRMLFDVTKEGGNLLLNIGVRPDGGVPEEALAPLRTVGAWIARNNGHIYGLKTPQRIQYHTTTPLTFEGTRVYAWNFIRPQDGVLRIGGIRQKLLRAAFLADGREIAFTQDEGQIVLAGLSASAFDLLTGVSVIALDFDAPVTFPGTGWYRQTSRYPQLNGGYGRFES